MTLKEWRMQQGLTQTALAKKWEWTPQMISALELGTRGGSLRTLDKIERLTDGAVKRTDWPAVKPRG